jgi:multidrug efflux system membrane fusion protein
MENDIAPPSPPARRHWLRWTVIGAAVAIAVAIVVYRSVTFVNEPQQQRRRWREAYPSLPVGVAHIDRGDIRLTLRALGAVTPLATINVTTQISGYLLSVGFKEGQLVKKGQLLAQIDPRPYQVALEEAEAQLARDQAALEQARMDLTRYETLAGQQSIARQTYEDQVWTVKQDQGTVDYDKALIKAQQLNLTYCRIVAPADGRVGLRQVDPGNYVQTGSTTGIVVLTVLAPTTVEFAVPEDSVPQVMERVHAGAQLPVTAFDRANVTQLAVGQLAAVDTQVNSTTGTVMLRANFDNADEKLFPSQFVNVVMLLDTLKDVVRVPARAVQRGAPGSYVYLVDAENTVAVHPIKLGDQDGDYFAVVSGLSPGDVVVTDGADRLRDGAKVSIPEPSATPAPPVAPSGPRAHGRGQGQGSAAGGHGNGQHHRRPPGNDDQPPSGQPPSSQPLPPSQPPGPVTPQPPAQRSSANPS